MKISAGRGNTKQIIEEHVCWVYTYGWVYTYCWVCTRGWRLFLIRGWAYTYGWVNAHGWEYG